MTGRMFFVTSEGAEGWARTEMAGRRHSESPAMAALQALAIEFLPIVIVIRSPSSLLGVSDARSARLALQSTLMLGHQSVKIEGMRRASLTDPFRYGPRDAPAPEIAQDFASGVVAGRTGDAASRVASRAAQIEARDRTPVIRMAQHRTR